MGSHTLGMRGNISGVLLALGLLTPAFAGTALAAAPTSQSLTGPAPAPVINSNFADPDVLLANGIYHAYATNDGGQNIQHQTSTDLVHWTAQPDALPQLGAWVGDCSFSPGGATDHCIWAPEVSEVEGGYAMFYTARLAPATGQPSQYQCIGAAFAATPSGPFVPDAQPLVCPTELGGAIDASTYRENGQLYLLWKADGNCCNLPATIFIQSLSADGRTLTGPPVALISNDSNSSEQRVVEAPTLFKHGDTYYLLYSANDFYGGNYRSMYATSSSVTGPYTKQGELMTSEMFRGDVVGPGGQDVTVGPDGGLWIVFHGWDRTFSYRAMFASKLNFAADGSLIVDRAARLYEAEDGVVSNARVVPDGSASGGAKVGGLDFPDSSVTIRVYAARPGPAVLGIRFANGSTDANGPTESSSSLTVNGASAGTVTYWHTTWGNWQVVEERVGLITGWNTITLTKSSFYAEVDAFYLSHGKVREQSPTPLVPATAVRYEAEAGVINHARIRPDGAASGGAVVGGLDFPDSSISWQVCVAKSGPATIAIRYTNGSERGGYALQAVHSLTVNGQRAGEVTYRHTRWGNWQTVARVVLMQKGCNTVTLTREAWYAEIDYIDVY